MEPSHTATLQKNYFSNSPGFVAPTHHQFHWTRLTFRCTFLPFVFVFISFIIIKAPLNGQSVFPSWYPYSILGYSFSDTFMASQLSEAIRWKTKFLTNTIILLQQWFTLVNCLQKLTKHCTSHHSAHDNEDIDDRKNLFLTSKLRRTQKQLHWYL
jgi:hypothetical protein